ncbi:putative lipoprotein lprE [Mycobacterium avium subsp. avium 2285 (R)]|nr:putative lipoprotein lprE [Mycobacterium avium subsp. avium 2285 (R)]
MRAAVGGDRQGQHQRDQPEHPGGAVPPRPIHPAGVPDTYGFNGIDPAQTTGDTVALTYPGGLSGLSTDVKFHWNGNAVELIGNTPAH